jgi:hypothetical protein
VSSFGRTVLPDTTGRPLQVIAVPPPDWKVGGVTIDWSTVAAVSGSDVTTPDEIVVKIGAKYLRYGQILAKITQREVQTITVTGTPTGGKTTATVVIAGVTYTVDIPYNASAATAQTAFDTALGAGKVTVSGGALPGTALSVTFNVAENVAAMTTVDAYTGGSSPASAIGTTTQGTTSRGSFGPYDPAASDGRQTLTRGECFILNETALEALAGSDHPGVFDGGIVWKDRLLITTGSHSLAAGPTVTEFETAFPRVSYALD